ncbi:hypothetical protein F4778DRAFT_759886 [Xylariomycetidae sp. FL2044]|nr:hypothetical protein F4778DRAFT_759886 [Xylariomycetidae sp. FL2044]
MSGGYYQYRCKYFYTYDCPNWVYVNNAQCPSCAAKGRDDDDPVPDSSSWPIAKEVRVPRVEDGMIQYTMMEVVNTGGDGGKDSTVKHKTVSQAQVPATQTTSATPGASTPATSF